MRVGGDPEDPTRNAYMLGYVKITDYVQMFGSEMILPQHPEDVSQVRKKLA